MKTFVDEIKSRKKTGVLDLGEVGKDTKKTIGDLANAMQAKGIASSKVKPQAVVPSVSGQVNSSGKRTDLNTNYMEKSQSAVKDGNLFGAAYNENMHNIKDGEYGLGWGASDMFNYQDKAGYGGLMDAKYREIEDHFSDGFKYDYRDDDMYKRILALKEKEADKAYEDGYAQLSQQFDGDIPVNMINKLLTTKQEIVDGADSYIPQLREMAYNMYLNDGNNLYNQYSMLKGEADTDYNRWNDKRNLLVQGVLQNEADKKYRESMDYAKERDAVSDAQWRENMDLALKEYERGVYEDDRDFNYMVGQDAKAEARRSSGGGGGGISRQDVADLALDIMKELPGANWDVALEKAMKYYYGD